MKRYLVSVIVPCYNAEKYVIETLNSIAKQTYRDFEIVCVNDGSVDDTKTIIESFILANPNLKTTIVNQSNSGVSAARNNGIKHSNGDYVVFIDSDDIINEHYLEYLLDSTINNDCDTAYCLLDTNKDAIEETSDKKKVLIQTQYQAMHRLLYKMGHIGFSCFIYKKNILETNNIRFFEDTKRFEDREFIWKYLTHCNNVAFVNKNLYWYRENEASEMHRKVYWNVDSIKAAIRVEDYLRDNHVQFYKRIKGYLVGRVAFALAVRFARGREKNFFDRLGYSYDMKKNMKSTLFHSHDFLISVLSLIYLIHPNLFYKLLSK